MRKYLHLLLIFTVVWGMTALFHTSKATAADATKEVIVQTTKPIYGPNGEIVGNQFVTVYREVKVVDGKAAMANAYSVLNRFY